MNFSLHGVDFMYHGAMEFDGFYRAYAETLLALDESVGSAIHQPPTTAKRTLLTPLVLLIPRHPSYRKRPKRRLNFLSLIRRPWAVPLSPVPCLTEPQP
jgi:hypothetical protein